MQLPPEASRLLREQKLCVLCTSAQDLPHASLMAFTYLPEEKVVIFATRRETTKSENITRNPRVALLVFGGIEEAGVSLSCTIEGTAHFVPDAQAEVYRAVHHRRHPNLPSFTEESDVAFVRVVFDRVTLADKQDRVRVFPGCEGTG